MNNSKSMDIDAELTRLSQSSLADTSKLEDRIIAKADNFVQHDELNKASAPRPLELPLRFNPIYSMAASVAVVGLVATLIFAGGSPLDAPISYEPALSVMEHGLDFQEALLLEEDLIFENIDTVFE